MEMIDIIRKRFSARKYKDVDIESDKEDILRECLRLAPSGKNAQPWKFIFVKDKEIREKLKKACKNQVSVGEAPLVVVGCGFPEKAYPAMGGYWNSVTCDISIAFTQLMLTAAEQGLGTCWIGAFYEEEVKDVLNIPENVMVVSLMTVGYSDEKGNKNRMRQDEIICYEKYEQ